MRYRIKSTRIPDWNYNDAWYYVTICTKDFISWFGVVSDEKMYLNPFGGKCNEAWNNIPSHYTTVELDSYIIMPNHVHGIIIINSSAPMPSLGNIVGGFKAEISRWANNNGYNSFRWQERFYDHIIRNVEDLNRIREYILNNPLKWNLKEMDI